MGSTVFTLVAIRMLHHQILLISITCLPSICLGDTHSLLMSGLTTHGLDTSITLLTDDGDCVPDLPALPEGRSNAGSTLLGNTILICGGGMEDGYSNTCHSYTLGSGQEEWMTESSMVLARQGFGMTAIQEKVYATGGLMGSTRYSSVEIYTPNSGWTMEDSMDMGKSRHHHCSIAFEDKLIVIGGYVDGHISSSVMSYNTDGETQDGWVAINSLNTARYYHACDSSYHLGNYGVFVAGGENTNFNRISTVEFLDSRTLTWIQLGDMKTARDNHSLSRINQKLVAAGGYDNGDNRLTSIEMFNGTHWMSAGHLAFERERHCSVSIPAGLVKCK